MLGKYQQHCQRLSHLSLFYYAFNAFIINMIMLCVFFFLLMLEYVLFNHVKKREKKCPSQHYAGSSVTGPIDFSLSTLQGLGTSPAFPSGSVEDKRVEGEACPQM